MIREYISRVAQYLYSRGFCTNIYTRHNTSLLPTLHRDLEAGLDVATPGFFTFRFRTNKNLRRHSISVEGAPIKICKKSMREVL